VPVSADPVPVAILGLGRSGWGLHAQTLAAHPGFRVAAVADPVPERRAEAVARFRCAAFATPEELLAAGGAGAELLVVATPSHTHVPLALAGLRAGMHVLVEKPMAERAAEVDALAAAARAAGRLVTCFLPLRLAADFLAVREVLASGRLGRPVLVRRTLSTFGRRADWQMLRRLGGGELSNNGPHLLDQVLELLGDGPVEVVAADLRRTVSAGDAEDHVKLWLRPAAGPGPVVDLEISRCDAFPPPEWTVLGTAGGLTGGRGELRVRWFDPTELPPLEVDPGPAPARRYGGEEIPWREETLRPRQERSPYALFYDRLHATLRGGAAPLVTPEGVRRHVEVIERARALAGFP
jgi:scyllo-inositol 2-dehydrogenase (NADP+)